MSVGAVNKQTGDRIPTAGMPAVDSILSGTSTNPVQNKVVKEALDAKQDTLTFDDTPTDGSNNPVKSNGIYDSEKDIYAAMGEMGAKNLIPYPYTDTTTTINDVTFTDNGDGTITVNGTASANTDFQIRARVTDPIAKLVKNKYTLSGAPTGGGNSSFDMRIGDTVNGSWHALGYDLGEGATFELNGDAFGVGIGIRIAKNYFCDNITFRPMLRLASDTDGTYQPYAKTNKQLTDDVALLDSEKADTDMVASDFDATASYTAGNYCIYEGKFYRFKNNHSGAWSAADVDEIKIAGELSALKSGLTNVDAALDVPENSGKNVLPITLDRLKALNSSGSWNNNLYTHKGLAYTVETNNDGYITSIKVNGTADSQAVFVLFYGDIGTGLYTLNGITGGSNSTYLFYEASAFGEVYSEKTANVSGSFEIDLYIRSGVALSNQMFYPMIRPATITDPTFAPYIPSVESRIEAVESGVARIVCTEIVYDDNASLFTLPAGVSKPKYGAQIMVCGRNRSTGAIYALWFDNSASGFKIGKILDGSAPADGTSISVQYIA